MNLTDLTAEQRREALNHLRRAACARAIQWDHERQIEAITGLDIDNGDELLSSLAGSVDADADEINPDDLTFITEEDLAAYCNS